MMMTMTRRTRLTVLALALTVSQAAVGVAQAATFFTVWAHVARGPTTVASGWVSDLTEAKAAVEAVLDQVAG